MKYLLIVILGLTLFSCKKKVNTTCTNCDTIREFDVNAVPPSKWGQDTIYVYDIITMNYCTTKMNHYVFQSDIKYSKRINECLSISCTTDSTGIQYCKIK